MKITVKQLKQLIREQLEEGWRDFATGDSAGASHEAQMGKADRDRYDLANEREREERRYREEQQARHDRERTPNDADREQAAARTRAAAQQQAAQAKQAAAAAATQKAKKDAKYLINALSSEDIAGDLIKNGTDAYNKHFAIWMNGKHDPFYDKKRQQWSPDVMKVLQDTTISSGPLKGQNAAEAIQKAAAGDLEGPGFMSKVKGFFGMKEVRQLVREEVARELRRRG